LVSESMSDTKIFRCSFSAAIRPFSSCSERRGLVYAVWQSSARPSARDVQTSPLGPSLLEQLALLPSVSNVLPAPAYAEESPQTVPPTRQQIPEFPSWSVVELPLRVTTNGSSRLSPSSSVTFFSGPRRFYHLRRL